jgi:TPR repeat protein
MNEPGYMKCECQHCTGRISFPEECLYQTIECPHCGGSTILGYVPRKPPKPPVAASPRRKLRRLYALLSIVAACGFLIIAFLGTRGAKINGGASPIVDNKIDPRLTTQIEAATQKAQTGDPMAQYELGKLLQSAKDMDGSQTNAAKWLMKSAKQGYPPAQNEIGNLFFHGRGVNQSYAEALTWYQQAAEQGLATAQFNYGTMFLHGNGVPRNPHLAVHWLRLAAEKGFSSAHVNLGFCYGNGFGLPRNENEALKWYSLGAHQGDEVGQTYLGECYENGYGVPVDLAESYKWYWLANRSSASTNIFRLDGKMSPEQIADAKRRAGLFVPAKPEALPKSEITVDISFADPGTNIFLNIRRVMFGQRVVDEGLYGQYPFNELRKRGQDLIHFRLSIHNVGVAGEHPIFTHHFQLEDDLGAVYPCELTMDYLRGTMHRGQFVEGGIAFPISSLRLPKRLIYNTGLSQNINLSHTSWTIRHYAVANGLERLEELRKYPTSVDCKPSL